MKTKNRLKIMVIINKGFEDIHKYFFENIFNLLEKKFDISYFVIPNMKHPIKKFLLGPLFILWYKYKTKGHKIFYEIISGGPRFINLAKDTFVYIHGGHEIKDKTEARKIKWENLNKIICVSHGTVERFLWRFKNKYSSKLVIAPIGINLKKFKFVKRNFKVPYKICIVGGVLRFKGIYGLIKMFMDLNDKDCKLTIVKGHPWGDFDEEYLFDCEQLAKNTKLNIEFINHIHYEKIQDFYKTQDIIISNSTIEGVHTAVIEAMATGCFPLINNWFSADKIYPREYIFNTQNEFIKKIDDWEKNKNKLHLSEKARKWVEKNFDAEKAVLKFEEIFYE